MLLEELLAELPGTRGRIGLCGKTLAPKKSRRLQADTLAVFRASPQGGRVANGIVQLPSCSVLLLDGCGAHFARHLHRCALRMHVLCEHTSRLLCSHQITSALSRKRPWMLASMPTVVYVHAVRP